MLGLDHQLIGKCVPVGVAGLAMNCRISWARVTVAVDRQLTRDQRSEVGQKFLNVQRCLQPQQGIESALRRRLATCGALGLALGSGESKYRHGLGSHEFTISDANFVPYIEYGSKFFCIKWLVFLFVCFRVIRRMIDVTPPVVVAWCQDIDSIPAFRGIWRAAYAIVFVLTVVDEVIDLIEMHEGVAASLFIHCGTGFFCIVMTWVDTGIRWQVFA